MHHMHYKSLGCESNVDLKALCSTCHAAQHGIEEPQLVPDRVIFPPLPILRFLSDAEMNNRRNAVIRELAQCESDV